MRRDERSRGVVRAVCLTMLFSGLLGAGPPPAEETPEERRARIESMDPARKAELLRAQERFAALGPAKQQQLRELHKKIQGHPRAGDLWHVMEQYCEWVRTLTPYERAELRELPPAERIEKIQQLRQEQARRRETGLGGSRGFPWGDRLRKLSSQEREVLTRWIDEYTAGSAPELVQAMPESRRAELLEELKQAQDDPERRRELFARMWIRWQLENPGGRPPFTDRALEELRSRLSPAAQQWLQEMPPDMRPRVLAGLIGAFVFIHTHEQLSEYLQNEISAEMRSRLTSLPPEQMQQELWRLYLRSKWPDMPGRFPEHPPGRRHPGPFQPPPGGPPRMPRGFGPDRAPPGPPLKDRPPTRQEGPSRETPAEAPGPDV